MTNTYTIQTSIFFIIFTIGTEKKDWWKTIHNRIKFSSWFVKKSDSFILSSAGVFIDMLQRKKFKGEQCFYQFHSNQIFMKNKSAEQNKHDGLFAVWMITNFPGECRTKNKKKNVLINNGNFSCHVHHFNFKMLCLSIKNSWLCYFEGFSRKQYTSWVVWLINLLIRFDFNCIYLSPTKKTSLDAT